MIIGIVFTHVWGVLELIALGSLTRTVRIRTVLTALVAGLYAASSVTVLLQLLWTRPFAWLTDIPLSTVVGVAGYTLDPFIEEVIKVLPLAALLMLPAVRRQWSLTDCVLIGAATGSGFGLAEALLRFGSSVTRALVTPDGWLLPVGFSAFTVPNATTTMLSWLPASVVSESVFGAPSIGDRLNLHLAWSALGGFAVGLIALRDGKAERIAGALLLLFVAADHAAFNADVSNPGRALALAATPFRYTRYALGLFPIVALAMAWWFDRHTHVRQPRPYPALPAERRASPAWKGAMSSALQRLPWSALWVAAYARVRRAYTAEERVRVNSTRELKSVVIRLRDTIAQASGSTTPIQLVPPTWRAKALGERVRDPQTVLWIIFTLPSVLYFGVGGQPATAAVQRVMSTPVAWFIIRAMSVASLIWLGVQIALALRQWPTVKAAPFGEFPAVAALRLMAGAGAFATGAYALSIALTNNSPSATLVNNAHILQALGAAVVITAILAALMALFLFPPGGLALAGGGVVGGVLTANMVANIAGVLGLLGVLLMASAGTPGNNQAQNRQFRDAVRNAEKHLGRRLTKDEMRRVHDEITSQDFGFHEIVEAILGMFGG